jgi:hypothetical protein
VKYADDLVLLVKKTVIQGMIDRVIETGKCYRMEINVDKTEVIKI